MEGAVKFQMNITTSYDDVCRFFSADDLKSFYKSHGCDGLEVMPLDNYDPADLEHPITPEECSLIRSSMVRGVHCCCLGDWMDKDREELIRHYRKDLDYAKWMGAEYVVFHVVQVNDEEGFTYVMQHEDREVLTAAASFINELLEGQDYDFWFLMENLWWPGLNFLSPEDTRYLLERVHYEKKGFMLDTGHFLHTNLDLKTQEEGVDYLNQMLDAHGDLVSYIKGIHLQQSLTGDYVKEWLSTRHELPEDPSERFCKVYEHIFKIDKHEPFTAEGVPAMVQRIQPLYVTYEYITRSREELGKYLDQGKILLMDCQKNKNVL